MPADVGGANWPGGSFDPETNRLYIHSHTSVYLNGLVAATPQQSDMGYIGGQARAAGAPGARAGGGAGGAVAGGARRRRHGAGPAAGQAALRPDHRLRHEHRRDGLAEDPLSTPDDIRNHPALRGLDLPRLGQPGRTFIGTLTTKTLLIAGEGGVHTNEAGRRVALLRAYDKLTGADVGAVEMPDKQTGSPMTYVIDGRQFIVLAVSGSDGAEILAYALP